MGDRALRLDYVSCVSHFGTELCGFIRDAKSHLHGTLGRMGLGILLIGAIGATGVGIFTTDPMPLHFPLSTRGTLHVIFGTSQLVLLPFSALLINLSLARNNEASGGGAASSTLDRWLTVVWLFKLCGLLGYFRVSLRPGCLWSRR
jgi:hypothetical protein